MPEQTKHVTIALTVRVEVPADTPVERLLVARRGPEVPLVVAPTAPDGHCWTPQAHILTFTQEIREGDWYPGPAALTALSTGQRKEREDRRAAALVDMRY